MAEYALRLANGQDTASRVRLGDALTLAPADALTARAGLRPGGGAVTVTEGTLTVEVAPFMGWVQGTASNAQGGYPFISDASKTLTLDAGDPAADRVDTIVARVRDDVYDSSGEFGASVEVVKGTPGGGAPVLPLSAVPLRDVTVPAGASAGTGGLSASDLGADRRAYTAALGGVVPVASATARDAMTAAVGQPVWRMDTNRLEVFNGTGWDAFTRAGDSAVLSRSVTTDNNGWATVTHNLGWTPSAVFVQLATTFGMASYPSWAADNLTASTVRVRGVKADGTVAAAVTVPLFLRLER